MRLLRNYSREIGPPYAGRLTCMDRSTIDSGDRAGMVTFDSDDWTKTTDPKQRKKIQDRLAQRARRAKLQAAKIAARSNNETSKQISPLLAGTQPNRHMQLTRKHHGSVNLTGNPSGTSLSLDPDAFHLVLGCQTVIHALTTNAKSIPVQCDIFVPKVLNANDINQPPSALVPTKLQSQIPHLAFVAAIPFAGLRDSILKALPYIDYQDLWRDSVGGGFFVWGLVPWSPQGWEVTEQWAQKWWFLLDSEVLETANFWRQQRGLPKLRRRITESSDTSCADTDQKSV